MPDERAPLPFGVPDLDAVNRRAWKLPATVRAYKRLEGWTDPGENAAVEYAAAQAHSQPILDIGVGGGRTTGILLKISRDYVGIDYTPEMVEACGAKYPGVRFMHMDARDLGSFGDNQFALVVFSFNGIDAMGLEDRHKVLAEVRRVLKPGGLFVFSAHNRAGPCIGQQPRLRLSFSWNPVKLGWRVWQLARSVPGTWRNYRRYQVLNEVHDHWAILNCAAHDFGIVVMYTTVAEQQRQLKAAGFETELVFDNVAGRVVTQDVDTRPVGWFHYVARKTSLGASRP